MNVLTWIVFGLIVGMVANWIMPARVLGGILGHVVIGVVGAFVGGWIYGLFGHAGVSGFNLPSMLCALTGAIALLWILRAIGTRSTA